MKQIVVGIPAQDTCYTDFAASLSTCVAYTNSRGIQTNTAVVTHQIIQKSSIIAHGRNKLVEAMMNIKGATHFMFFDSDMMFPPDTILALLETGKDIVAADYIMRRPPHNRVSFALEGVDYANNTDLVFPVKSVGFGCILIKREVFEKISPPWFNSYYDGTEIQGEDVDFCRKAREQGYSIMVHEGMSHLTGHIGTFTYKIEMLEALHGKK